MSSEDSNPATISALLESLVTSQHVGLSFLILTDMVAVLVFTFELHMLEIHLSVTMHLSNSDLPARAFLGALAASFFPRHEAVTTIGGIAFGTFDRVLDDHTTDAAAKVLAFLFHLLIPN